LLAAAFGRLGEGAFAHLRGGWVALVWDREREIGAIVRDRAGEQPLHLAGRGDGGFTFAPELPELLDVLPMQPPPDDVWLAHFLARRVAPRERTPYAGVQRLPAGWLVSLERSHWRLRPWWRPRPPAQRRLDAEAAAAELRVAMRSAVERATARAATPGVMLSGGFDSASVAALAAAQRPLRAYSGVFPAHPNADESQRIARLRSHIGLPGVEHELRGGGALAATFDFMRAWRVPPATPNFFLWQALIERAASDGVDVLLDGEGGDELFGCAPPLLADLLRRGRLVKLLTTTRRVPGMGDRLEARKLRRALGLYALRPALPPGLHRAMRAARANRSEGRDWLAAPHRSLLDDTARDAWKRRAGPRWWAYLVQAIGPGPDAMGAADHLRREAECCGLRVAHPWADTELADFVLSLPPDLAFDPDLDRPLARMAMADLVPDAVRLDDAKPYFNDPLTDALTGPDSELTAELATADEVSPYVHLDRVRELLGRPGGPAWPLDVWRLATVAAWLRQLGDPAALDRLRERAEPASLGVRNHTAEARSRASFR
jgi:asparagine synthase (glutamine-hydrolysing)